MNDLRTLGGGGKGALVLVCRKCTRQRRFEGASTSDAAKLAKAYGWVKSGYDEYVCPKCPAIREMAAKCA